MSTSKHIDIICVFAVLAALFITVLFMNGEALGVTVLADDGGDDEPFTANDLDGDWDTTGATYITLTGDGGSVKGNGAYVYDGDVHIVYAGKYVLSGELTDGSVIIDADGDDKIWLMLDGVSLHCDRSAAMIVEQADKVFLTLAEGSENVISSGAEYSDDAVSDGIDGAIYSRDDLTVNGAGSLTVTAEYSHGIVGNDDLVITGGTIHITAAQDGIHAHDSVRFTNADLTISAGDDGITASNDDETAYVYIGSGSITIPSCYEGIEAVDVTVAGGEIHIRPTDDGINANGQGLDSAIRITGGHITIVNETGRDADGLDSNGSIYISGGRTFISVNSSSCALDYGAENGGECLISGGTVIAAGGSAMAVGFDSASEQAFIMYTTNAAAGTQVTLTSSTGDTLLSETIPCGFSSLVLSTPEMRLGETCTLTIGDAQAEVTVDNSTASAGFGMGGGMQGGKDFGRGGGRDFGRGDVAGGMPGMGMGEMPDDGGFPGMPGGEPLEMPDGEAPVMPDRGMPNMAEGGSPPDMFGDQTAGFREGSPMDSDLASQQEQDTSRTDSLSLLGASVLVLAIGLLFAFKFKR